MELSEIEAIVSEIEREKEAGRLIVTVLNNHTDGTEEAERKRTRLAATAAGQAAMASRADAGQPSGQ